MRQRYSFGILLLLAGVFYLSVPVATQAITLERAKEVRIFSATNALEKIFVPSLLDSTAGGVHVAAADFGDDGVAEVVVATDYGEAPFVQVVRADGSIIAQFIPYDDEVLSGVAVTVGDVDGDGQKEIITGRGFGATPLIRVFDMFGHPKLGAGFYPFDSNYVGGVSVAAGDVDGDGMDEIIVATGRDAAPHVKVYDGNGVSQSIDFHPFSSIEQKGLEVAVANVDGGLAAELVITQSTTGGGIVKTYKYNEARTIVGEFKAFDKFFAGGLSLAAADFDSNGVDEIIVAPKGSEGPHVLAYRAHGERMSPDITAFEFDFRGGVHLAAADVTGDGVPDVIATPARIAPDGPEDLAKAIVITLADQRLRYYENGVKAGEFVISSGKSGMDTPLGDWKVMNKSPRAWSAKYGLYMPYWMQFTSAGHGIHELPEWPGGYKEGLNHLGIKISHGCVRVGMGSSAELWNWAEVGTPILVRN